MARSAPSWLQLYITQDSFGTACNVSGDNAIGVIVETIYRRFISQILRPVRRIPYVLYQCFDVLGPNMIGPSSSHTAGAAVIAYLAHKMIAPPLKKVDFTLYGSFAKTYRHGTDRALSAASWASRPTTPHPQFVFDCDRARSVPLIHAV